MKFDKLAIGAIIFLFTPSLLMAQAKQVLQYPTAPKTDQVDDYHGNKVPDPYRMLENDTSEVTRTWVKAEDKVTFDYLGKIPFREQLKKRIEQVYNYPKYSAPFRKGEYFYFSKNNGLQNQAVLYRQKGLDGQPELLIDPNTFSTDGTTKLQAFDLSKDGHFAIYALSKGGSDWQTYYVRDMWTGKDLADTLS